MSSNLKNQFQELESSNGKCYIWVENNQDFKILMNVAEEFSDNVFGCRLYLDGKVRW